MLDFSVMYVGLFCQICMSFLSFVCVARVDAPRRIFILYMFVCLFCHVYRSLLSYVFSVMCVCCAKRCSSSHFHHVTYFCMSLLSCIQVTFAYSLCDIRISHVTCKWVWHDSYMTPYEWVMSRINSPHIHYVTYESVMSHTNETRHVWIMSHMNETRYIYKVGLSCTSESHYTSRSYVTYKWGMLHISELHNINESCQI